jgi:putative transport protein
MVLGVLLGPIPIPIPGVGTVTRSADRGSYRRQAAPNRSVALGDAASREHLLRNFGLAMFLAAVGINAGQPFGRTISETGLTMLFIGAAVPTQLRFAANL